MSIRYLNDGLRDYTVARLPPHRRFNWEFEVSVDGALAPTFNDGTIVAPRISTMWILPPSVSHGWINPAGQPVEIRVFHVVSPPEPLRSFVESQRFVGVSLSPEAMHQVLIWYEQLIALKKQPDSTTELRYQTVVCEMSLLLLEQAGYNEPLSAGTIAETRVQNAIDWYSSNLQNQPSLEAVAAAVNISVPQLRRHFYAVRQQSPREVFQQLRFDRALELLDQANLSLESIAETCGYSCLSAFSRAWKTHYGEPPRMSRRLS